MAKSKATPEAVKEWQEAVDKSQGSRVFLPDALVEDAEAVEEMRKDLNAEIQRIAKKEIALNVATQNLFMAFREKLEESGREDIWVKEVGFDVDAREAGLFVVNVTDGRK